MTYQVEIREEINALVSYISAQSPSDEDLKIYLDEVIRLQQRIIQNNASRLYHVLVIESNRYSLRDGMHVIRTVQQNKALYAARKKLSIMTILVGQMPKSLQIMITMMSPSTAGRQVAVFATLEAALDFVRVDNANYQHHPAKSGPLEL